jgi:hypothetical protein
MSKPSEHARDFYEIRRYPDPHNNSNFDIVARFAMAEHAIEYFDRVVEARGQPEQRHRIVTVKRARL